MELHVSIPNLWSAMSRTFNRMTTPYRVLVSSFAAAGPALPGKRRAESDPPTPIANHGHSKLAGEFAALRYAGMVPITILRPPIVLGEADRDGFQLFESIARWNLQLTTRQPESGFFTLLCILSDRSRPVSCRFAVDPNHTEPQERS